MRAAIMACVLASSGTAWAQGGITASQVVANVDAIYGRAHTFRASFTQEYLAHAYHTTKTETGTISVTRPNQATFTYANGNRVVANGSRVAVYQASTNQTFMQTLSQTQFAGPLSFLSGGSLASSFHLQLQPGAAFHFSGGYVLVGSPITPTGAYTTALFFVDGQTFQVRRVLLVDAQQNRNRFDFANAQIAP